MGFQARKDAMEGLEEFERQTLINPYESIKPSLAAENTALNRISEGMANVRDVSSGMDASSALATLSVGNEQAGQQRQDVINNMMQIQNKIDFASAGAEMNLQDIKERRDEVDLASLQAQFASGTQDMFDGAMGVANLSLQAGLSEEMRQAGLGIDKRAARMNNPFSSKSNANDGTNLPGIATDPQSISARFDALYDKYGMDNPAAGVTSSDISQFSLTQPSMFPSRGEAYARYIKGEATLADLRVLAPVLSTINTLNK